MIVFSSFASSTDRRRAAIQAPWSLHLWACDPVMSPKLQVTRRASGFWSPSPLIAKILHLGQNIHSNYNITHIFYTIMSS